MQPFADISYTDISETSMKWCFPCVFQAQVYTEMETHETFYGILWTKILLTNQHKKNMKTPTSPRLFLYEGKAAFRRGAPRNACNRTVTQFLITTRLANFRSSGSSVLRLDWILLWRIDSTLFASMSIAKQQLAHPNTRTRNVHSPCVTNAESAEKCSSSRYIFLTCCIPPIFTYNEPFAKRRAMKMRSGSSSSSVVDTQQLDHQEEIDRFRLLS